MRGASTHMENEQLCLHYEFGFTFVNHQLQSNRRFMHICEITCNFVIFFFKYDESELINNDMKPD